MKKKYLQPTTQQVIVLGRIAMLADSSEYAGGDRGDYSGSGQLSRQGGMWDDEEQEY